MNFASDNISGASPRVLAALAGAGQAAAPSYGADDLTTRVSRAFGALFEREVEVFLVATGTAANALALAGMVPPWGSILAHAEAHIAVDECGAPEFLAGGAKILGLSGAGTKLSAEALEEALDPGFLRPPHTSVPSALSLTQATEVGTLYTVEEVAALAEIAHRHGLGVHMDGARFANAVTRLGCTPAELTWRAGVDVLSFGGTKNGAVAVEAVVVFDPARADNLAFRRKRAGHLLSKHRFFAAQMLALIEDGHWLDLAQAANRAADRLAEGLSRRGVRIAFPVDANLVFPILQHAVAERLKAGGAIFYDWPTRSFTPGAVPGPDEAVYRLAASFATADEDVDGLLALFDGI